MMLAESLARLRDPRFIASTCNELLLRTWDNVMPGEYSTMYRSIRQATMASDARLRALYQAVTRVVNENIVGDIVECGTARGGSAALMALKAKRMNSQKQLWVFDTFEGMPPPSSNDPDFATAQSYVGTCRGELAEVAALMTSLEVHARTHLVKGLFQDTLSAAPIERIALLHIDGDWHDSVMVCLETFYDRVSPQGIIQIDDYGYWQGARVAVDDFFRRRDTDPRLRYIDYAGRQLTKQ